MTPDPGGSNPEPQPSIATAAFLVADPARAAMLIALLDGRARPANGLLTVEAEGRRRYYRLAGPHVALALETLASIGPKEPTRPKAITREAQRLQFARCCYDHLAGRLGVAVTLELQAHGCLVAAGDKQFKVTPVGVKWLNGLGLDITLIKPSRRGLARQCLDWTERRHHLAGPLGVQFTSLLVAKGWNSAVDLVSRGGGDAEGVDRAQGAPRP